MNVRYRVELSQTERGELTAILTVARTRRAGASGRRFCWPLTRGPVTRRLPGALVWVGPPSIEPKNQTTFCTWQSEGGAERGAASWCRAQAQRQGGSLAGGDRVLEPPDWPCPLDA